MENKACSKCKNVSNVSNFNRNKSSRDGFSWWCKPCIKDDYQQNIQLRREQAKKHARDHVSRQQGKEQRRKTCEKWRAENADKARKATAEWKKNNIEACRSHVRNRRAIIKNAAGTHSASDVKTILASQNHLCYYCSEELDNNYHVDHKIPLSRGGSNYPENLACACPLCNLKKGNKTDKEFELVSYE